MKKTITLAACLATLTLFASCKKEYTCNCTTVTDMAGLSTTTSNSSHTVTTTKSKAESACKGMNTTSDFMGITSKTTCSL